MAQPNALDPVFKGKVTAAAFEGLHGNGVSVTCVSTNGTTNVNVFDDTAGFYGTVTGVWLIAKDATAANITLVGPEGTYCTIAKGGTAGALVGASSLTYTAITPDGSLQVDSSVASGQAYVFVAYKVS